MGETEYVKNKFDYSEIAKIREEAPTRYRPGEVILILEIIKIKSEVEAAEHESNVGEWIYIVKQIGGGKVQFLSVT